MKNVRMAWVDEALKQLAIERMLAELPSISIKLSKETATPRFFSPGESTPIAVGQLRVLSGAQRPVTVLVYKQWDELSWVIVPVSTLNVPATQDEILIQGRAYQTWNMSTLNTAELNKGYVTGTVSEAELDDVGAHILNVTVGDALSESLVQQTGLPITEPDDLRLAYREEALNELEPIRYNSNRALAFCHLLSSEPLPSIVKKVCQFKQAAGSTRSVHSPCFVLTASDSEQMEQFEQHQLMVRMRKPLVTIETTDVIEAKNMKWFIDEPELVAQWSILRVVFLDLVNESILGEGELKDGVITLTTLSGAPRQKPIETTNDIAVFLIKE